MAHLESQSDDLFDQEMARCPKLLQEFCQDFCKSLGPRGVSPLSPRLTDLSASLAEELQNTDLIVFDGECVLCSSFYRFVLRFDRKKHFSFATAQSDLGQRLYQVLNLPTDDFQTNLVIVDGQVFDHLDSFAATMKRLGWPWRILSVVRFLPRAVKTQLYTLIARNRYRLFGRYDTCVMPTKEVRARFVPGGW